MSTIRVAKRNRYTQIDRRAINDGRLTFKARGLLAWLLDKPDDWRISRDLIAEKGPDGKAAIQSALQELTRLGYLVRNKYRNSDGTFGIESVLYEVPTTAENRSLVTRSPVTDFPTPDNPAPDNRSVIKELRPKTDKAFAPKTEGSPTLGKLPETWKDQERKSLNDRRAEAAEKLEKQKPDPVPRDMPLDWRKAMTK